MSEPLPIERFADLSAEIEVTGDKEQVLSRETLAPETWERTKAHWLRVMADESERRRLKVSIRYQNHFVAKRKLYEARVRRQPLEDKLAGITPPPVAHLQAAAPAMTDALTSSAERVNAPQPPRVEAPAVPRPAAVGAVHIEQRAPLTFDAPSVPAVRTAPMAATPMRGAPVVPDIVPAPPIAAAPSATPAPPPRRMWSTMITDGMPSAQPATPFRTGSETGIPAQGVSRAPGPPPAPPPPPSSATGATPPAPPPPVAPPAVARPPASAVASPQAPPPMASPPRDPKLAGTVTFDLDEMLGAQAAVAGAPAERVGTGTGPLPSGRGNAGLPFDRREEKSAAATAKPAPRTSPPPAPPPPAPPPPAAVARGREPIPEHLHATSAVDLSQIIQAITPFAGKASSSSAPPQRIPTPPGSVSGLPFAGSSPSPPPPRASEAARPKPPASFGATSFADPITSSGPATPFAAKPASPPTAKLHVGPPRLSINVFASIAAEIAEAPADTEAILRKYAMDKEDHFEESMRWEAEFERNADMRLRYGGIVARYRGYIAQRKGK